jgi:hypothetical protein
MYPRRITPQDLHQGIVQIHEAIWAGSARGAFSASSARNERRDDDKDDSFGMCIFKGMEKSLRGKTR